MRSPIIKILIIAVCITISNISNAQIATSNPLEYVALAEGNELILGQIKDLKTASGFASSLKACTHLYNDGVKIFITLGKLKYAIGDNPQGIVASMNMNNLYIETATELVSVFSLLQDAIAKGGKENMLTGSERSKTLWALNDKLSAFQKKLNLLHLSIRHYTMTDVWNNVTAGMLDRSNGEVAQMALRRWQKSATFR